MKILVISNYFFPEIGASSSRIFHMVEHLANHAESVEVACPFPNYPTGRIQGNYKGLYKKESINDIIVHRFFIYPDNSENRIKRIFSMLSFATSLWLLLIKTDLSKIDKVIIQNSPLLVSFSSILIFKFFFSKELILNISDLWPQSAVDLGFMKKNGIAHRIFSVIEKFNYKYSDKFLVQSQDIFDHFNFITKPKLLYRNIPNTTKKIKTNIRKRKPKENRIIYAGLLGVAQGILNLITYVEKMKINISFDIYGEGAEKTKIIEYLKKHNLKNIRYMGALSKDKIISKYSNYDFAFVPLASNIKGAFPSKIYELISSNIPIIYIGHGEAYSFINEKRLGIALRSNEIYKLENELSAITDEIYSEMLFNSCLVSKKEINFNRQIKRLIKFLNEK